MAAEDLLNSLPEDHYGEHLGVLRERTASDLDQHELDAVVVSAGTYEDGHYHRNDTGAAFRPNAQFARWAGGLDIVQGGEESGAKTSLTSTPGHFVYFDKEDVGDKPRIFIESDPANVWALPPNVPAAAEEFFRVHVGAREKLMKEFAEISSGKVVAHIGRQSFLKSDDSLGGILQEPKNFARAMEGSGLVKTPYEIAAMNMANKMSAKGHEQAKRAFLEGGSEGEVMMNFLMGSEQREAYLPYPPVVGIGPHGAALHYESAEFGYKDGNSLLLDAGNTELWYPSDITTTYVKPKAHTAFKDLVKGLDKIQKDLVSMLNNTNEFDDLQKEMMIMIGQLLLDVGILRDCTALDAAEQNYTHAFCPHSVGHSLGINTHDAGQPKFGTDGKRIIHGEEAGKILKGASQRRQFAENQVVTVEPGIYFIKPLLDKFRNNPQFNWSLIDQLEGGIRIETDVWLTSNETKSQAGRVVDLSRRWLPEGTNV